MHRAISPAFDWGYIQMLAKMFAVLSLLFFTIACGKDDPTDSGSQMKWSVQKTSSWSDPISSTQVNYSIKVADSSIGVKKTLYAFHGMNGNEKDFCNELTVHSRSFAENRSISHLVCISFGPYWVIHERNRDQVFERFQTYVQNQYGASKTIKPVLYGASMGGFNAVKLSLRSQYTSNRKDLPFQKVAVGCPAIFADIPLGFRPFIAPFLSDSAFGTFDRRTSVSIMADSPYNEAVGGRTFFPKMYVAANAGDKIGLMNLIISGYGLLDMKGIYYGAKTFAEELQRQNQPVKFESLPGNHCEGLPVDKMVRFLGED